MPELLKAAADLDRGPGWSGVQFYRANLLAELGDRSQTRQVLDELIPVLANRPSSLNRAHALRAQVSGSFKDALHYGMRPSASWGSMTSSGEKRVRWRWHRWEEERLGPPPSEAVVMPELAHILNSAVPLTVFSRLATSSVDVPERLRGEFVLAAWVRAVLLEDWGTAKRLAASAAKLVPETAASMEKFRASDVAFLPLAAKLILLRFPGIGAEVRSGIGRNAPLSHIQLDGLNWWWWKDGYSVGYARPESVAIDWVSDENRARARAEWDRIVGLGEGHDWLYQGILDECGRPEPPALCAEALYRVAVSYKAVGSWHDPVWLDLDLGRLDTRVPPILHRAFPRSVWTRHVDSDIKGLTQPWRDPEGGYRNVVPYPR